MKPKKTLPKKKVQPASSIIDLKVLPAPNDVTPNTNQQLEYNPAQMLITAINNKLDPSMIERFMDLNDRWQKDIAKKEFTAAFAEFQKSCPVLYKGNYNSYNTKGGDKVSYNSADISDVDTATKESLAINGLTKDWEIEQLDGKVKITCVITHVGGHSKRVPLIAEADTSGGKNAIQALGSSITYLERYTLMAALGLTAKGMDDDGRGHNPTSQEQEANIDTRPKLKDEQVINIARAIKKGEKTLEEFEKISLISNSQKDTIAKFLSKTEDGKN